MERRDFGKIILGGAATVFTGATLRGDMAVPEGVFGRVAHLQGSLRDRSLGVADGDGLDTAEAGKDVQLVLPEVPQVDLPEYRVVRNVTSKSNDKSAMPEAQLMSVSAALVNKITEALKSEKPNDLNGFLKIVAIFLAKELDRNPILNKEWKEQQSRFAQRPGLDVISQRALTIKWFNRYLEPSGYFIGYYGKGGDHIGLYKTEGAQVEVKDGVGTVVAPVLILKEPVYAVGREAPNGYFVEAEDRVFIYKETVEKKRQNAFDEALMHEATHYYMSRRFPGNAGKAARFDFEIADNRGRKRPFSGQKPMIFADEMVALGAQWANSKAPKVALLECIREAGGEYVLARYVASLAIAAHAKSNIGAKNKLIEAIFNQGATLMPGEDALLLTSLVQSSDFSDDDARAVGEYAYRMGHSAFMRAEREQ